MSYNATYPKVSPELLRLGMGMVVSSLGVSNGLPLIMFGI